ncbi:DMT family transporter [Paludibacter jiangxiensis]|uniref:Permease of the drug/metabolite transporter DMT superfamily n=1 Tax=Paludibacter jiangxiensis TaxID=681398 RepID=A0A171AG94_9BACT|nr:DMT family transporter [Paludibacter jiangxiensis]GAT63679.1 permease of the drug/metabolite transporter DMT superfamily [Paludibacter jiangxiensis]
MNKTKLQGHAAIFVAAIIFGANFPITKHLMPHWMSPWALTYSRFAFGAIAFWTLSLFVKKERVPRKDMFTLLLGSMLGVGFNQALFIFGLQYTSPTDASIVNTVMPIMAMVISFFILKEPITLKKAGGVFLGLFGVLCVILSAHVPAGASKSAPILGDLFCALSCLMYAFFLVITRDVSKRYSPVTIMKWMFLFSTILSFPFGYKDLLTANLFVSGSLNEWLSYGYLLVGATFITYLLMPVAQKRIRPTTIGMYNYVQPLVASVIAISIGQDEFTWIKPIAAILIFAGVYFVTTSKSREDIERELVEVKPALDSEDADRFQVEVVTQQINKDKKIN